MTTFDIELNQVNKLLAQMGKPAVKVKPVGKMGNVFDIVTHDGQRLEVRLDMADVFYILRGMNVALAYVVGDTGREE